MRHFRGIFSELLILIFSKTIPIPDKENTQNITETPENGLILLSYFEIYKKISHGN